MRLGPGVDVRCDSDDIIPMFPLGSFDVVISTEMLEHCKDWRLACANMKDLVKPGGMLVVTTRGPGMVYHPEETKEGAYGDFWRFTIKDFEYIFSDFNTIKLAPDPELPGVLYKGRKPLQDNYREPKDLTKLEVARI